MHREYFIIHDQMYNTFILYFVQLNIILPLFIFVVISFV